MSNFEDTPLTLGVQRAGGISIISNKCNHNTTCNNRKYIKIHNFKYYQIMKYRKMDKNTACNAFTLLTITILS